MSADIAARLRSLAQEHHDGRLDLAAYRSLRGPLLDSLATSGASPPAMEVTQPRVAHRQMQRDAITRPGKPRVVSALAPDSPSSAARSAGFGQAGAQLVSSRRLQQIAIAIAIVIVVAGVLWVWFVRSPASRQGGDGIGSSSNAGVPAPGATRDAIEQFMGGGDWGDGRLTTLNATLMELGGEQIASLAHEPGFQRFVDELRRRLKEQQALSPTTLTVDNSPLAALAVTVGVDLNSPDSALHISAAPPTHVAESSTATRPNDPTNQTNSATAQRRSAEHSSGAKEAMLGADSTPSASSLPQVAATQAIGTGAGEANGDASGGVDTRATAATNVGGDTSAKNGVDPRNALRAPAIANVAPSTDVASGADACRPELVHSRRPLCHDPLPAGAEGPLMALIPAGAFDMGSTAGPEEQPVHHVTIADAFAVSVYEVSQGEFKQYCESTHRQCASQPWLGDDYPVVNVSWDDARGYADWLSGITHHHYSLPTEAQWEYAARAGSTGLFPSGTSLSPTDANFSMQKKQTAAARRSQKFNANAFRLVHTVGNVREWVEDPWSPSFAGAPNDGSAVKSTKPAKRIARGGSYTDGSVRLRLSMREGLAPDTRDATTGFRIVRELP